MYVYTFKCGVPSTIKITRGADAKERAFHRWFFKIGVTSNVGKRLRMLQTGCPLSIYRVADRKMPSRFAAYDLERQLHERYEGRRTVGEWFSLVPREQEELVLILKDGIGLIHLEKVASPA